MKKTILLFLAIAGLLNAQQDPRPDAPVRLTFKTIGFQLTRNDLFVRGPTGYAPLVVIASCVSGKSYHYTGPITMPIFRKIKSRSHDRKDASYEPVSLVTFPPFDPSTTGRFILILSSPDGKALNATPIADDTKSFPLHTVRVINAYPAPAGVLVNKDAIVMHPSEARCFPVGDSQEKRVELHVAVQFQNRWVEANNIIFSVDKDSRRTIFVINNTPPNAPDYQPPSVSFLSLSDAPKPENDDLGAKLSMNDFASR